MEVQANSKAQVTVRLDKSRLARAQKLLSAKAATEAIENALDLATEKAAHDAVIRKYSGVARRIPLPIAYFAILIVGHADFHVEPLKGSPKGASIPFGQGRGY